MSLGFPGIVVQRNCLENNMLFAVQDDPLFFKRPVDIFKVVFKQLYLGCENTTGSSGSTGIGFIFFPNSVIFVFAENHSNREL